MKKFGAIVLCAVLCLAMLPLNALAAGITLEYYIWSDEETYIRPVVEAWNAQNPDVQVNLNVVAGDEYDDKVKILLSSGGSADVLGIRTLSEVAQFAAAGSIPDLTDRISDSGLDVTQYGAFWNGAAVDGRYYALPTRATAWMLFYNKDLFDAAGIEYPGQLTWDEYAELAVQMKNSFDDDNVMGGYMVNWEMMFMGIQHGLYLTDDDTTYLYESLAFLNKIYNEDGSHLSYADMSAMGTSPTTEFEAGRAALEMNGEWMITNLLRDTAAGKTDVNWGITYMPVPEGVEPGTTWGQLTFATISSDSKYPDEAFQFLTFLCGEEGSSILAQNKIVPAYSSDAVSESYIEATGREDLGLLFTFNRIQEQPALPYFKEVLSAYNEWAGLYLIGEKTLDEAMEGFVAQRESIIDSY